MVEEKTEEIPKEVKKMGKGKQTKLIWQGRTMGITLSGFNGLTLQKGIPIEVSDEVIDWMEENYKGQFELTDKTYDEYAEELEKKKRKAKE